MRYSDGGQPQRGCAFGIASALLSGDRTRLKAVANVMYARAVQVNLRGIVLSCITPDAAAQFNNWTPINLIESLTQIPVLGIIPYLTTSQDLEVLARVISNFEDKFA